MKVVIITSSKKGTAAHHFSYLLNSQKFELIGVIVSKNIPTNNKKNYSRVFRKILKIGIFGALNGIRMRKWFNDNVNDSLKLENIDLQCLQNKIPYYEVNSINSVETKTILDLLNSDLVISLGNGYISKNIFLIPEKGMINIHHEILPDYQNAQSIIWQIYNKSKTTGYTIHKIDSKIDTGDILFQKPVDIIFADSLSKTILCTSIELLKASAIGLRTLLEDYPYYASKSIKQGIGNKYTTPSFYQFLKIYFNYKRLRKFKS